MICTGSLYNAAESPTFASITPELLWEDHPVYEVITKHGHDPVLVAQLQMAHDEGHDDVWPPVLSLRKIAFLHDLSDAVIDE